MSRQENQADVDQGWRRQQDHDWKWVNLIKLVQQRLKTRPSKNTVKVHLEIAIAGKHWWDPGCQRSHNLFWEESWIGRMIISMKYPFIIHYIITSLFRTTLTPINELMVALEMYCWAKPYYPIWGWEYARRLRSRRSLKVNHILSLSESM